MKHLLFAVLIVGGCVDYGPQPDSEPVRTSTVEITSSGFVPKSILVGAGDTVTFINKDTRPHWPASAVHPTHNAYPEPGGCIGSSFDACRALSQGESFNFTFNHKGTWTYHDHMNPPVIGIIVVE